MVMQTFLRIILLDFLGGYRMAKKPSIYLTGCDDGMMTKLLAGTYLGSTAIFQSFEDELIFYNERSGRDPVMKVSESQVHRTLMFIVVYNDEGNGSAWGSMVSGCESSCPCNL